MQRLAHSILQAKGIVYSTIIPSKTDQTDISVNGNREIYVSKSYYKLEFR